MSVLKRYKMNGGFHKLIVLLESLNDQKREKMIKVILNEDKHWGMLAREKLLNINEIFQWDTNTLQLVTQSIQPRVMASAIFRQPKEVQSRFLNKICDPSYSRQVRDLFPAESTDEEQLKAVERIVLGKIRQLDDAKIISLKSVAPEKVADDPKQGYVIIVDPTEKYRRFLSDQLHAFEVVEVESGAKAWEYLQNNTEKKISAVFSETALPELEGMDLLHNIREHKDYEKLPFVFVTSEMDKSEKATAQQLAVTSFIEKPIQKQEVAKVLKLIAA